MDMCSIWWFSEFCVRTRNILKNQISSMVMIVMHVFNCSKGKKWKKNLKEKKHVWFDDEGNFFVSTG